LLHLIFKDHKPTAGVNFFLPVAATAIESILGIAEGSAVADGTRDYSPTAPWVETHG
jgi:hypothetical protein